MKKIVILIFAIFCLATTLVAEEVAKKYIVTDEMSLLEIAEKNFVPVKKITAYLDKEYSLTFAQKSIRENKISTADITSALKRFDDESVRFAWTIVALGMAVVFVALSVTWGIISMFKFIAIHDDRKKRGHSKNVVAVTQKGKKEPEPDISTNAIIAAITAIHLHNLEVEETNKMMLTWRRAPISMWKQYYKIMMPNREYNQSTKRK